MTKQDGTMKPASNQKLGAPTIKCEAACLGSEIADLWERISIVDESSIEFQDTGAQPQGSSLVKVAANCAMRCLEERKDFLEFELAGLEASSPQGALAQLLVAYGAAGMAYEASDKWLKADYQKLFDQLMYRIIGYLERQGGQSVSELGLNPYVRAQDPAEGLAELGALVTTGSQMSKAKVQAA